MAWVGSDFNDHLVPDLTQLAIHFPEITELTKKKQQNTSGKVPSFNFRFPNNEDNFGNNMKITTNLY